MRILFIIFVLLTPACKGMRDSMDQASFGWFGGTIFSSPSQVTMKEIHLDNGDMIGNEIIVEGTVVNVAEYTTHLVISDETARMLIVLTNLESADDVFSASSPKVLRILGTVERGKKGLPYVMAKALNFEKKDKTKTRKHR